jgi:uncharacterized protein DUF1549
VKEQVAGDELDHPSRDSLIATAFLRCYAKVGFREKDNPQFRYDYLDDMIATIGRGILGLTVQCARCHNHKFDPISQKDYYRMQASLFGYVEVDHSLTTPDAAAAYEKKLAAIETRIRPLRQEIRDIERPYRDRLLPEKYRAFPENVQIAIRTPEAFLTKRSNASCSARIWNASGNWKRKSGTSKKRDRLRFPRPWGLPMAIIALRPTVPVMSRSQVRGSNRRPPRAAFLTTVRAVIGPHLHIFSFMAITKAAVRRWNRGLSRSSRTETRRLRFHRPMVALRAGGLRSPNGWYRPTIL